MHFRHSKTRKHFRSDKPEPLNFCCTIWSRHCNISAVKWFFQAPTFPCVKYTSFLISMLTRLILDLVTSKLLIFSKLRSFTISWTTPASSSSEVKGWLKNSAYLLTLTKGSFLMSSYFKNNARLVWYAFLSAPRLLVPTHFWPWRARVDATTLPSSTYWCLLDQQAKIRHNLAQSSRFLNYEPI